VLQYELSKAGGGGRTFVRGVKEYVKRVATQRAARIACLPFTMECAVIDVK